MRIFKKKKYLYTSIETASFHSETLGTKRRHFARPERDPTHYQEDPRVL